MDIYAVLFFVALFLLFRAWYTDGYLVAVVEGLEDGTPTTVYKEYSQGDSTLPQQNANNIQYLKQRLDALEPLQAKVDDLSTQVEGLVQQQADYATDPTGGGEELQVDGLDTATT